MTKGEVRPFSRPWTLEERGESFVVSDSAGVTLSYVYFEDESTRRRLSQRLSKQDARRMAEQILQLGDVGQSP